MPLDNSIPFLLASHTSKLLKSTSQTSISKIKKHHLFIERQGKLPMAVDPSLTPHASNQSHTPPPTPHHTPAAPQSALAASPPDSRDHCSKLTSHPHHA
jgi:hypothetical protein